MSPQMLAELSRVFEKEAYQTNSRRLLNIARELYLRAKAAAVCSILLF